jgi:hypothetical protein
VSTDLCDSEDPADARVFPSSEDQMETQASQAAVLVPIQIDIDVDTFKIRDAFVWNLNGVQPVSLPESPTKSSAQRNSSHRNRSPTPSVTTSTFR